MLFNPTEETQSCVCIALLGVRLFCTSGNLYYTEDKFSGGTNTCWNKRECESAACTEPCIGEPVLGLILTGQIPVEAQQKEENGRNFALRQCVPPNNGLNSFPLHTGAANGNLQDVCTTHL